MTISSSIKKQTKKRPPLWKGPEDPGPMGGISQSMLNRFLADRERFRLSVIEGLQAPPTFNHRLEFGNLWHECEEALAEGKNWEMRLKSAASKMMEKYPYSVDEIKKWWHVINVQFPVYVDYWKSHRDTQKRTPLMQEHVFHVPYTPPNGRVVWIRGKFDSVDLVEKCVWLQENKTKSEIDEAAINEQLRFDLQTMFYLIALWEQPSCDIHRYGYFRWQDGKEYKIKGVRYNVIRRPFSGGKGSIRKHKPTKKNPRGESDSDFYGRLRDNYIAKEPGNWFRRWSAEISQTDIHRFKVRFLNPILTQLCLWYDAVTQDDPFAMDEDSTGIHWQTPYGVYNPLQEGARTDQDNYLNTGSEVGLRRVDELFPELK